MPRFHTKAGYFGKVIEKQVVDIKQNEHARDEDGNFLFLEDGATPVMRTVDVKATIDVPMMVWVDQVNIPFTPEEEAEWDAQEAAAELERQENEKKHFEEEKKKAIDALTLKMSEELLLSDDDGKTIKDNYRAKKQIIEAVPNLDELNRLEIK